MLVMNECILLASQLPIWWYQISESWQSLDQLPRWRILPDLLTIGRFLLSLSCPGWWRGRLSKGTCTLPFKHQLWNLN